MPSYQSNQIGIAALLCFLLLSAPAVAQRADSDQPFSLIGDAGDTGPVVAGQKKQQSAQANADDNQTIANDADGAVSVAVTALPIPVRPMRR